MSSWVWFIDAAFPPPNLEGCQGLAFYAGGDAAHVWTPAEVAGMGARFLLPVFMRSNPVAARAPSDAAAFISALRTVYHAPPGVLVALDSETSADPGYVTVFVRLLNSAGYPVIDYGSVSTVFGNANPDGYYWGADWTNIPHLHDGTQATQFAALKLYDLSEFSSTLPLWDTEKTQPERGRVTNMMVIRNGENSWLYVAPGVLKQIVEGADLAALAAVLPVAVVSDGMFSRLSSGA